MNEQQKKLIDWCEKQVGTAEVPKGSNSIVYNSLYYGRAVSGAAYPWCMAFVWCAFDACGLKSLFYAGCKTASCTTLMKWSKNVGQFVTAPYQAGDVMFYDQDGNKLDAEHTGIFTGKYDGDKLIMIEGNYNDQVSEVKRSLSQIIGAYRPKWDEAANAADDASGGMKIPEIRRGDKGAAVVSMQILLDIYGFDVGPDGADGDFGPNTEAAVKRFQTAAGLAADGICGEGTWAALINYGGAKT